MRYYFSCEEKKTLKNILKDYDWLRKLPYFSFVGALVLLAALLSVPLPAGTALPTLLTEAALFVVLGVALMRESKNAFPVFLMGLVFLFGQVLLWTSGTGGVLTSAALVAGLWLLLFVELGLAVAYETDYKIAGMKGEVFSNVVVWLLLVYSASKMLVSASGAGWGLAVAFVSLGSIFGELKEAKDYGVFMQIFGVLLALGVVFVARAAALSLI